MGVRLWYFALLLACLLVAWRWGGREERQSMVLFAVASVATVVLFNVGAGAFDEVRPGPVVVDVLTLAALLWITLTSRYYWPMLVAAFQLVTVSTHGAMLIDPNVVPRAYAAGLTFWVYPMLAVIVWASLRRRSSSPIKKTSLRR